MVAPTTTLGDHMSHHALHAASLVLTALAAVGCGGQAPADASQEKFCGAYDSLFEDMGAMAEPDEGELIATIKAWGRRMQETGTPEDIPEEARRGFESSMEMIEELDEETTAEDFDKLDEQLSDAERDAVEAFDTWTTETCGSPLDDMELPDMPELPEVPSDLPTE